MKKQKYLSSVKANHFKNLGWCLSLKVKCLGIDKTLKIMIKEDQIIWNSSIMNDFDIIIY